MQYNEQDESRGGNAASFSSRAAQLLAYAFAGRRRPRARAPPKRMRFVRRQWEVLRSRQRSADRRPTVRNKVLLSVIFIHHGYVEREFDGFENVADIATCVCEVRAPGRFARISRHVRRTRSCPCSKLCTSQSRVFPALRRGLQMGLRDQSNIHCSRFLLNSDD